MIVLRNITKMNNEKENIFHRSDITTTKFVVFYPFHLFHYLFKKKWDIVTFICGFFMLFNFI